MKMPAGFIIEQRLINRRVSVTKLNGNLYGLMFRRLLKPSERTDAEEKVLVTQVKLSRGAMIAVMGVIQQLLLAESEVEALGDKAEEEAE